MVGLQQYAPKRKSIKHFQILLNDETWDTVYKANCINEMYNSFQTTLIRHFEASFPVTYADYKTNKNNWITKGIKTSCNKKRELYLLYRDDKNNAQIKDHYKKYSSILKRVIN